MEQHIASENPARLTIGAIVASAIVAALLAFFLRRAMRSDESPTLESMSDISNLNDTDLRERAVAATNEFLRAHVAPEVKPMLLNVLKDVQDYVEKGFHRAEQSIKDL
ncbi:MAG: hypothetical protein EXR58_01795 [Chloroflexi bacterium]|nr:hypothetical protein [Chloroflexota bacterium]